MPSFSEVVHSTIVEVLVALIMTAAVTVWGKIKDKWSWPTMILYGLVTVACVLFIFDRFSRPSEPVEEVANEQNIESKITEWLTASGMKNGRFVQPPEGCSFAYDVLLPDGNGLSVCRPSAAHESKYLLFSTRINLSDENAALFDKQDQPTKTYFVNVMGIEAGRAKLSINLAPPYHSMLLVRKMPINGMTEYLFNTAIQDHHMACHLMLSTLDNSIADIRAEEKSRQLSPTPGKGASPH